MGRSLSCTLPAQGVAWLRSSCSTQRRAELTCNEQTRHRCCVDHITLQFLLQAPSCRGSRAVTMVIAIHTGYQLAEHSSLVHAELGSTRVSMCSTECGMFRRDPISCQNRRLIGQAVISVGSGLTRSAFSLWPLARGARHRQPPRSDHCMHPVFGFQHADRIREAWTTAGASQASRAASRTVPPW